MQSKQLKDLAAVVGLRELINWLEINIYVITETSANFYAKFLQEKSLSRQLVYHLWAKDCRNFFSR